MSKEQDIAAAEATLLAAEAEVEAPAADTVLDRGRAYGTVAGEYVVGETRVRYQQDGLNFDFYGNLIKG